MKRNTLLALVSLSLLAGCASTDGVQHYSVVPQVQVTERTPTKRPSQANYQTRPEESPLSGSGGSAR
ncbi:hypothetical protein [Anaeromyxobacter oryzisoli]|uniref:hypothetical protein n=1 Tax=Anaeromyxobacter oryzisoli TaxID=2925408 RepID=UPI001F5A2D85|nr:hypothetical protein [Anaeromyxobacter sp. SG63]